MFAKFEDEVGVEVVVNVRTVARAERKGGVAGSDRDRPTVLHLTTGEQVTVREPLGEVAWRLTRGGANEPDALVYSERMAKECKGFDGLPRFLGSNLQGGVVHAEPNAA